MRRPIPLLIVTLLFCVLAYFWLDKPLLLYIHAKMANTPLEHGLIILGAYTKSNYWVGLACISLAIAILRWLLQKHPLKNNPFVFFSACIYTNYIVVFFLKFFIGRSRPSELLQNNIYAFHPMTTQYTFTSMPSGHAASAFAGFLALALIFKKYRSASILCITCAIFIALSRVMIAKHYPSDIVLGSVVGALVVIGLSKLDWLKPNPLMYIVKERTA